MTITFQKLNLGYQFGPNPNTFLHLLGSQSLAPPCLTSFRQVHERALRRDQRSQFLEDSVARCRNESIPCASDVYQFIVPVVPNNDGVQAMRPTREAADHELLADVYSVLDPSSATLSRFVDTVLSLPNDSF